MSRSWPRAVSMMTEKQIPDRDLVVHHEHGRGLAIMLGPLSGRATDGGERDAEARAHARLALHGQGPAMPLHDPLRVPEAAFSGERPLGASGRVE
jgi:hypothetical protein